jgi:probable F420-dependent oxidoreductase
MRFGVHLGPQSMPMAEMRRVWHRIEELGFDWVSVWDHFYAASLPFNEPCYESLTSHAALAVDTQTVRVGCLVYSTGYRHPTLLAKAGVTIDHLSEGRLEMGLGAGWHEEEYRAYGLPFERPAVRLRRLAESIEVVRLLWSQPVVDYVGEFFQLRGALCEPKPVQDLPPIWVGARGERALALAGRLGDGWNASYFSPNQFAQAADVVRANSARSIRCGVNVGLMGDIPVADRERFLIDRFGPNTEPLAEAMLAGPPSEMIARVGEYQQAGADWFILALRAPLDMSALEAFATQVLPVFAEVLR